MMKLNRIYYYLGVTILTAVLWFWLLRFGRLPGGVDADFVSTMFVAYLVVVFLVTAWYESKRKKRNRSDDR